MSGAPCPVAAALADAVLERREAMLDSRLMVRENEYRRAVGRELRKLDLQEEWVDQTKRAADRSIGRLYARKIPLDTLNRTREIAGHAARITGHLAAWLDTGVKLSRLERLVRTGKGGGAAWQVVQLGAMGMAALGIGRLSRLATLAGRLRLAASAGMAAGAAGSVTGVGVALFLLGLALQMVAEWMLSDYEETELEKALRYGFFGRDAYETNLFGIPYGPHAPPPARVVPADEADPATPQDDDYPAPGWARDYRPWFVARELGPLYEVLFSFRLRAEPRFLGEMLSWTPRADGHTLVLWGQVEFSRFLPRRSRVECEFVIPRPGRREDRVVRLDEMLVLPREEGGALVRLDCYWPVRGEDEVNAFSFRARVDAHGDGEFRVPADGEWRATRARVPDGYDVTDPYAARNMVNQYMMRLSYDEMAIRDLARRALVLMDRLEYGGPVDVEEALGALRRRHRYLLSRRSDIERELARVAEVSPGTEAWSRLARRLALRASGEEVL